MAWIDEQPTVRAVQVLQALDVHQWETIRQLAERHQTGRLSSDGFRTATERVIERAAYKADELVQASARPGR